jgi:hypothetical protein
MNATARAWLDAKHEYRVALLKFLIEQLEAEIEALAHLQRLGQVWLVRRLERE